MNPASHECQQCGKAIIGKRSDAKFCSDLCRVQHHYHQKPRPPRPALAQRCLECGNAIIGKRIDALYCCADCRNSYHYRTDTQPARATLRICPRHPATRTLLTGFKQRICEACRAAHVAIKARNQIRLRLSYARQRELKALQKLQP